MPIRRSQKKRNAEPRPKQNQRRLVIDPMVNPGSSAHRHQARSKAHPTRTHHRMVTLAQRSPGDRSAYAPKSKTATVMLGSKPNQAIEAGPQIRFKLCKELDDGERVLVERCAVGGDRSIASEEPSWGTPGR